MLLWSIACKISCRLVCCWTVVSTHYSDVIYNGHDGVSNHRRLECLFNCLFRRRSKKTPKFRDTGLCEGNPSVAGGFPSERVSNVEKVSIQWHHHVVNCTYWVHLMPGIASIWISRLSRIGIRCVICDWFCLSDFTWNVINYAISSPNLQQLSKPIDFIATLYWGRICILSNVETTMGRTCLRTWQEDYNGTIIYPGNAARIWGSRQKFYTNDVWSAKMYSRSLFAQTLWTTYIFIVSTFPADALALSSTLAYLAPITNMV